PTCACAFSCLPHVVSFPSASAPQALPSFPTRRSSDLSRGGVQRGPRHRPIHPRRHLMATIRRPLPWIAAATLLTSACGYNTIQRSEEHTSELQSRFDLVCRLLLEKKKTKQQPHHDAYH